MNTILTPFLEATYTNFLTKSAKPKSLTLRPHRTFMPLRFKASRRISSYMTGEIPFKTEIKACNFTRHDSIEVRFYIVR